MTDIDRTQVSSDKRSDVPTDEAALTADVPDVKRRTANGTMSQEEKMERLRKLIVGPQLQQAQQRIDRLEAALEDTQRTMKQLRTTLSEEIDQRTRTAVGELNERIDKEAQRQREALSEADAHQTKLLHALKSDQQRTELELRAALDAIVERLHNNEDDRAALGDILMEAGRNLKSNVPTQMVDSLLNELDTEYGV